MNIEKIIEKRDVVELRKLMKEYNLVIDNDKLVPANESAKNKLIFQKNLLNQRQQARKILLNSLCFGA